MMNPVRKYHNCLFVLPFLLVGLASCKQRKFGDSGVRHEAAAFRAMSTLPQAWTETTREEHEKFLRIVGSFEEGDTVLPPDSEIGKRLQYWIDKIDAQYRAQVKDIAPSIPKPQAFVIDSRIDNAFVTVSPVCVEVPVAAAGVAPKAGPAIDPGVIAYGGMVDWALSMHADQRRFCARPGTNFTPEKVVEYLKVITPNCKPAFTGGRFEFDPTCVPFLADGAVAARLVLLPTSNYITFYTKLMKSVTSEAEFVAVIAHELGHYYGGHASYDEAPFVYQQEEEKNKLVKPTEIRAYSHLSKDGEAAESAMLESFSFDPNFKTEVPKQLAKALFSDPGLLGEGALPVDACRRAAGKLGTLIKSDFDWSFSVETANVVRETYYPDFEREFVSCAKALPLVIDTRSRKPNVPSSSLEIATASLNATLYRNLLSVPSVGAAKTLWGGILDLDKQTRGIQERLKAAKGEVHERKLGLYTTEQEADDFSVEMMAALGLEPKAAINMHMDFVRLSAAEPVPPPYDQVFPNENPVECEKRLKSGWRIDGKYVFEPIGAFSSLHHSSCYRAFNTHREFVSHAYPPGKPIDDAALPGGAWAKLLTAPLKGFAQEATSAESASKESARLRKCFAKVLRLKLPRNMCL